MKEIQQDNNGNSKYYTPTIDEFHVGFEFRMLRVDDNPKSDTFQYSSWENWVYEGILDLDEEINHYIKHGLICVKHLDREDIESLGWEFDGDDEEFNCINYFCEDDYNVVLQFWTDDMCSNGERVPISIERLSENNNKMVLFCGWIKNKSELKKLMKQLHIPIATNDK